eukprot:TRINITY_DN6092_c0_g1_i2.p1 TRINITY_DN6092_c0_g1~~TRINITY_DN6092_c0_g1_i2.p1  ORF type:complete len:170 (-),score=41.84 TRINITY_DN6092_c0_g1_i2:344-784(-)
MIHAAPKVSTGATTTEAWAQGHAWTKAAVCTGSGVIVEGALRDVRMHALTVAGDLAQQLPTRFVALQLEVRWASRRRFDPRTGMEIMPEEGKMHTFVGTEKMGAMQYSRQTMEKKETGLDEVAPSAVGSIIYSKPGASLHCADADA